MTEISAPRPTAEASGAEPAETAALPVRPWYVSALLAVCAVTLLLAGAWGFARLKSPYPFYGTAYGSGTVAGAFQGTDHNRRPFAFTPGQTGGKTTALFFGFTHCPNICPLSLAYLDKVRQALPPAERERFQVIMVSVDPQRDTPERLGAYVTFFGQAQGVNVPPEALKDVARAYGVSAQKADVRSDAEYQINHTTATYLIDSAGKLRVLWDYTQLPQVDRVLRDVQYVMDNPAS
ncbi:SCO family protein [Deinococcus deserti]|uniref:Putative Electron transport protein SCO1/SenC n=1 Tax=Deinococcus deserti (strain DSM 17065 / CIP 109153 / LMG 22923 / VCD115) TaxID=546414 RepID=C1CZX4_DEIDV|nr:SCO family protein [Deinococcus deserti]ACO45226.1 putative Electron transport protein SCO1/SenC [Deinococcus deserti VCD115]